MTESPLRIAIITLSDRAAAGKRQDESGNVIRNLVASLHAQIIAQKVLPDDVEQLAAELRRLADDENVEVILPVLPHAVKLLRDEKVEDVEHQLKNQKQKANTNWAQLKCRS